MAVGLTGYRFSGVSSTGRQPDLILQASCGLHCRRMFLANRWVYFAAILNWAAAEDSLLVLRPFPGATSEIPPGVSWIERKFALTWRIDSGYVYANVRRSSPEHMSQKAALLEPFSCKRLRKWFWSIADPFQSCSCPLSIADGHWSKQLEVNRGRRVLCSLLFAQSMGVEHEHDDVRRCGAL
jgi:hypothetical protein